MVGDGINDCEAMREADLSIAVGFGSHASVCAHVVSQTLNFIPGLIIADETIKNIYQNLTWTGFYNVISLSAAAGLLYPSFGFVLNPILASLCMTLSSLFVVLNSMRLSYIIQDALVDYRTPATKPKNFFGQSLIDYFHIREMIASLVNFFSFQIPNLPLPPVLNSSFVSRIPVKPSKELISSTHARPRAHSEPNINHYQLRSTGKKHSFE
jgi:magnesium-transporting ATPase (P-type)